VAFRPKLPSMERLVDVGIAFVILMVIFQFFPVLKFWERIPPLVGGRRA